MNTLAQAGPLLTLSDSKKCGGSLCVFEEALTWSHNERLESINPCHVCHARACLGSGSNTRRCSGRTVPIRSSTSVRRIRRAWSEVREEPEQILKVCHATLARRHELWADGIAADGFTEAVSNAPRASDREIYSHMRSQRDTR